MYKYHTAHRAVMPNWLLGMAYKRKTKMRWYYQSRGIEFEEWLTELYIMYLELEHEFKQKQLEQKGKDFTTWMTVAIRNYISHSLTKHVAYLTKKRRYEDVACFLNAAHLKADTVDQCYELKIAYENEDEIPFSICKKYVGADLTLTVAEEYLVFLLNARKFRNGARNLIYEPCLSSHGIPKSYLQMAMDDALVDKAISIFERSGLKVVPYGKTLRAARGIKEEIQSLIEQGVTDIEDIKKKLILKNYLIRGKRASALVYDSFKKLKRDRPENKKSAAHAPINAHIDAMIKQGKQNQQIIASCRDIFPQITYQTNIAPKISKARKKLGIPNPKVAA